MGRGKAWTDEDKAIAVAMRRAKIPIPKIAERLGRTPHAIESLCSQKKATVTLNHKGGRTRAMAQAFVGQWREDCLDPRPETDGRQD